MAQLKSVNQIFFVVVFMSKGFSSTEFDLSVKINYPESSCYCQNQSNQLIENYRSILDRKQSNISSWKILEENGQMCFIRGTRSCQTTDALVIRFDHFCLIHPWYKDINLNDEILTSFPRKQMSSVLEVVLLEDNHSSSKYQLAIIECPCVERYGTFCTFCRCTLSATEPTKLNDQEEKLESSIVPILSNDKNDNALQLISRETQTKLYAILLPPSPLSEMRKATIEMTFDDKITRACQTNTLFYLMKTKTTSMQKPLTVEHRPMINKNDYLSVNSLSHMDIESIRNDRQDQNKMKLMVDNFDIIRPPPKCINLCEKVDFDRSEVNVSMNALQTNVSITTSRSNNHLEPSPNCLQNERRVKSSVIKTEEIKVDPMKSQTLSSSSSFIITIDRDHQNDQSIIPTLLNAHLLFATATKHTSVSEHIQTLSTNDKTSVDELINYQISLATQANYRSVSIVIDDIKSLEKHRENFLHSFYNTLFTTFRRTLEDQSIKLTCMNLIYFNHSFYDRLTMQRLRLIDTGTKLFLQPLSTEISLKTEEDIAGAIRRLRTRMSHVHQLLIINVYRLPSMATCGSFLFLQLAPISISRSSGLLTNLNGTTYSVMNLIRQMNKFHSSHPSMTKKRYLFNGCTLNRLLKHYVSASHQTLSVFKIKPKTS